MEVKCAYKSVLTAIRLAIIRNNIILYCKKIIICRDAQSFFLLSDMSLSATMEHAPFVSSRCLSVMLHQFIAGIQVCIAVDSEKMFIGKKRSPVGQM